MKSKEAFFVFFGIKKIKPFLFLYFFLFFGGVVLLTFIEKANAALVPPTPNPLSVIVSTPDQTQIDLQKDSLETIRRKLQRASAIAFKNALSYFLNNIAIDAATYLASGGEGQKPLFYTQGWGDYLTNLGDKAAGAFIDDLASGIGFGNVCAPSFNLRAGISLGLLRTLRPPEPRCAFSSLVRNWETAFNNPEKVLEALQSKFSPYENELAIAVNVYTNFYSRIFFETSVGEEERREGGGLKSLKDEITGVVKTPATLIREQLGFSFADYPSLENTYIPEAADAIEGALNTFSNTLATKMLERIFQKGFVSGFSSSPKSSKRDRWESLEAVLSEEAAPQTPGRASVREEFSDFLTSSRIIGNPNENQINIPSQLLSEGIINERLKTAIERELTVGEAIEAGLLSADGPGSIFGYKTADIQPDIYEGYSHNAMIILRKYRILPVGWEIAASYIRDNFQSKAYSLGDMIRAYDDSSSPFYHLVDKNWVLKSPATFCRLEGPGEKLLLDDWVTETIIDNTKEPPREYEFDRHIVARQNYCADTKSCIYEDDSGNCLYYGYCTQERSLWRFEAKSCPAYFNTCENFQSRDGDTLTLLSSTINNEGCSAETVGCGWYCTDFNPQNNQWTCLGEGERVIRPCDNAGGCTVVDPVTGETCTIPEGAISCTVPACPEEENFIFNPSFETAGTDAREFASRWIRAVPAVGDPGYDPSFIQRVSGLNEQVYSGSYSAKLSSSGESQRIVARTHVDFSSAFPEGQNGSKAFVLSGKVFNVLTYGQAYLVILDGNNQEYEIGRGCRTDTDMVKGEWVDVRCTFSIDSNDPNQKNDTYVGLVISGVGQDGRLFGTAWFDNIRIQPACPKEDVVIYMDSVLEEPGSKIFFDQDVRTCDRQNDGCSKLIRTKPGLGTNLVPNASFELWEAGVPLDWSVHIQGGVQSGDTAQAILQIIDAEEAAVGSQFLRFNGRIGETVTVTVESPNLFALERGKAYRVSLYAKGELGGETFSVELRRMDINRNVEVRTDLTIERESDISTTSRWKRYVFDPIPLDLQFFDAANLRIQGDPNVDIDGVMVEEISLDNPGVPAAYSDYGERNVVYLKKPPRYLECTGNPETDNSRCAEYAQICQPNEVGCEQYTPVNGDPPVPGIVSRFDQCPAECVGYDAFKQSATYFEQEQFPVYFIPDTAVQCDSDEVGCEEFTNLDELARGGESREYYKFLRQCQRPNNSCQTFYTWIGSEVNGFQLRVYSLVDADRNGAPDTIPVPRSDLGECENAQDAAENPNCREFFSTAGGDPSYALIQTTIACTNECVPYRLSGIDQESCEMSGGYWGVCTDYNGTCSSIGGIVLTGSNECWAVQSRCTDPNAGGNFAPRNQCIYQAVPSESEQCRASNAQCREYRGNASGNTRVVFYDDFESGTTENWSMGVLSNEALAVGGHSLLSQSNEVATWFVSGDAGKRECNNSNYTTLCSDDNTVNCWDEKTSTCIFHDPRQSNLTCRAQEGSLGCGVLDGVFTAGTNYLLTFWAKTAQGTGVTNVELFLRRPDQPRGQIRLDDVQSVRVGLEWQKYTIGPFTIPEGEIQNGLSLVLLSQAQGNQANFHVDFVTLKAVQEYLYLIRNSWETPDICDMNPFTDPPAPAPQFMLGCQEYTDSSGSVQYLKSFERLCRESAVGCEKMIDTQNSEMAVAEIFNTNETLGEVRVPEDEVIYLVNSPDAACDAAQVGCQAFGEPMLAQDETARVTGYQTRYLVNNPDEYSAILCSASAVGCEEFVSENEGLVYFKDPGGRTCEYRAVPGTSFYGWFKTGSNSSFPDCPTAANTLGVDQPSKSCVGGDRPGGRCESDQDCLGGGRCVPWTGVCSENFSGCTAYIDPLSQTEATLLSNGNFESSFFVCRNTPTVPCTNSDECNPGDICASELSDPQERDSLTRFYFWTPSSDDAASFLSSEGIARSSALRINDSGSISQTLTLDKGLYTLLVRSRQSSAGAVRLEANSAIFERFDDSVDIVNGRVVTLSAVNTSADEFRLFAGRFYVNRDGSRPTIRISGEGIYDDIELKKSSIYYNIEGSVDKGSCNGTVDIEAGCILFNDTSQDFLAFSSMASESGSPPALCGEETGLVCDSNAVIRVKRDRTCGSWLECVSSRQRLNPKTGEVESICQEVAECTSLDPISGKCNNFPTVNQTVQEFQHPGEVDLIKNFSGYSKIGMIWPGNTPYIEGYYPYAAMKQRKICVQPLSRFGEECLVDEDCQSSPLEDNGVCQPVLQVRDDREIYQSCRLYPEGGSPRWGANGPVDTGEKPAASVITDLANPLGAFDTLNQKNLENASECVYYKDNKKRLFEGLYGFCVEKDPRSPYMCLNWLPVDELTGGTVGVSAWVDRENIRNEMYYCVEGSNLETRKSGKEDKCYRAEWWETVLAWLPALFYLNPVIKGGILAEYYDYQTSKSCGSVVCPVGYIPSVEQKSCGDIIQPGTKCIWRCVPDPSDYKFTDEDGVKWYDYRSRKDNKERETKKHIMYCPDCGSNGRVIYDPEKDEPRYWLRVCDAVVKVTDESGSNKAWKKRLEVIPEFRDFGYEVPDYGYVIDTLNNPFGALNPRWRGDPSSWEYLVDKIDAQKNDSPLFDDFEGSENIGQLYHDSFSVPPYGQGQGDQDPFATTLDGGLERIKRLFAQSYGFWYWDGAAYQKIKDIERRCVGGVNAGNICQDNSQCQDTQSQCQTANGGFCGYYDSDNKIAVEKRDFSCSDDPNQRSQQCAGQITCEEKGKFGVCSGDRRLACWDDAQCQQAGLGNCVDIGQYGICSGGIDDGSPCTSNSDCEAGEAVCIGTCSATSLRAGQECRRDITSQDSDTADQFCRVNGICQNFSYWEPPKDLCPGNARPSLFRENPSADDTGDWCGVVPQIYNITVENASGHIYTIHQEESITLKFNVQVDDNQLPLRFIEIDWGDNKPKTTFAPRLGVRDRRDPSDPFIFTHIYQYDSSLDGDPDYDQDNSDNKELLLRIRIRVKDNWGWCSCDRLGAQVCKGGDATSDFCNDDQDWITAGTQIRVCENTC